MSMVQLARKLQVFGTGFSKLTSQLLIAIKPEAITLLQFEILHFLYSERSATLGQIAACTGMSLPNTSREVRKLMEKSLVAKRAALEDKRVYYVELTPEGQELMALSDSRLEQLVADRYAGLSPDETGQVTAALELLSDKLLKLNDGEPPGQASHNGQE